MSDNDKKQSDFSKSHGMFIVQSHFPGRAAIDAYGNGGFRFAQMSHCGSILCLPSGIYGWNVENNGELITKNFRQLLKEAADIEILLVGTGDELHVLDKNLRNSLRAANISADPMNTGAAVRTFNILLAEGRAVAAGLLAVD